MFAEIYGYMINNPFYSLALSSVSFLIGVLIGHWLAVGRDRRSEYNKAAQQFREVFNSTLQKLQSPHTGVAWDILIKDYERHHIAVIEFENYLKGWERNKFLKAWNNYIPLEQYCAKDINMSLEKQKEVEHLGLERIKSIVAFGKPR